MSISETRSQKSTAGSLSPEYPLLGLLRDGPSHGYHLHRRLHQELGQIWRVSLSQTYNILNRLESSGFIKGVNQQQAGLPDRRQFNLTATGVKRFDDWLKSPSGPSVKAIRVEFFTRLYFTMVSDSDLTQKMISDQITNTKAGLSELKESLEKSTFKSPINRLSLELRIRHLETTIDWLHECRVTLNPDRNLA